MKIISDVPGNRVAELSPVEVRMHEYGEALLDEGWDLATALRYMERRFGKAEAAFSRRWLY